MDKTRRPRQAESISCETDKFPLSGHMHTSGLAPPVPACGAHLTLVRCHRCLLGGPICHAGERGGSHKQEIQPSACPRCPSTTVFISCWSNSSSHSKIKAREKAENKNWEKGGIHRSKLSPDTTSHPGTLSRNKKPTLPLKWLI